MMLPTLAAVCNEFMASSRYQKGQPPRDAPRRGELFYVPGLRSARSSIPPGWFFWPRAARSPDRLLLMEGPRLRSRPTCTGTAPRCVARSPWGRCRFRCRSPNPRRPPHRTLVCNSFSAGRARAGVPVAPANQPFRAGPSPTLAPTRPAIRVLSRPACRTASPGCRVRTSVAAGEGSRQALATRNQSAVPGPSKPVPRIQTAARVRTTCSSAPARSRVATSWQASARPGRSSRSA